jgi:hypothetical protein
MQTFFKDIFKLFSKVLKIKEKKTAANSTYTLFPSLIQTLTACICKTLALFPFIPSIRCFFVFFSSAIALAAFGCMLSFAIVCAIAANSCKLAVVYIAMNRMLKLEACTLASGAVNNSGG